MAQWESPFGPRTTADEVLESIDLAGKRGIVTGANVGIGFETARSLASSGGSLILACRSHAKGEAAAQRIRERHPRAEVEQRHLDLASLDSVRAFCDELTDRSIDFVVCNAGVYGGGYQETENGFERTVGVCHVGHFLLAHLLLGRITAEGGGRIVLVSSESHRSPRRLDFEKLPLSEKDYSDMRAYGQAKLCNVLHAKELQRRFDDRGLLAYSLHPGTLVPTGIGRNSFLATLVIFVARPFTKSPAQGAATSVLCAAHPDVARVAGEYFSDCRVARASREACDPGVARRLWELSEEWVGPWLPSQERASCP